jgi:chromosome segregation ATPase
MIDESVIRARLDSLGNLVTEAEEGNTKKWKDVWAEIKQIGPMFKECRFPTPGDRQAAWDRFQSIVANVKLSQEKAKQEAEERRRESEQQLAHLRGLIDSLNSLADAAEGNRDKWKEVWSEIKTIGILFKETRFPTPKDRQDAWKQYQSIIARVKASRQNAQEAIEKRVNQSEHHLSQLRSYAWSATPSPESADAIIAICTGGLSLLIEAGLQAILGPFDERKFELQRCSEALREGWAYLSKYKSEMLANHKKEGFDVLKSAEDSLNTAWDTWKSARQNALDQYHAEKREAWEARQAEKRERLAKREAWEEKVRENISNLQARLERLEDVLERRRSHLSELESNRNSAWSDSYRDRVEGWIDEERERIADIESKIDQIKGWIVEAEAKLR